MYDCAHCDRVFDDREQRAAHREEEHGGNRDGEGRCMLCRQLFPSIFTFADHFEENHSMGMVQLLESASTRRERRKGPIRIASWKIEVAFNKGGKFFSLEEMKRMNSNSMLMGGFGSDEDEEEERDEGGGGREEESVREDEVKWIGERRLPNETTLLPIKEEDGNLLILSLRNNEGVSSIQLETSEESKEIPPSPAPTEGYLDEGEMEKEDLGEKIFEDLETKPLKIEPSIEVLRGLYHYDDGEEEKESRKRSHQEDDMEEVKRKRGLTTRDTNIPHTTATTTPFPHQPTTTLWKDAHQLANTHSISTSSSNPSNVPSYSVGDQLQLMKGGYPQMLPTPTIPNAPAMAPTVPVHMVPNYQIGMPTMGGIHPGLMAPAQMMPNVQPGMVDPRWMASMYPPNMFPIPQMGSFPMGMMNYNGMPMMQSTTETAAFHQMNPQQFFPQPQPPFHTGFTSNYNMSQNFTPFTGGEPKLNVHSGPKRVQSISPEQKTMGPLDSVMMSPCTTAFSSHSDLEKKEDTMGGNLNMDNTSTLEDDIEKPVVDMKTGEVRFPRGFPQEKMLEVFQQMAAVQVASSQPSSQIGNSFSTPQELPLGEEDNEECGSKVFTEGKSEKSEAMEEMPDLFLQKEEEETVVFSSASSLQSFTAMAADPLEEGEILEEEEECSRVAIYSGGALRLQTLSSPVSLSPDAPPCTVDRDYWNGNGVNARPRCGYCQSIARRNRVNHYERNHYNVYYSLIRSRHSDIEKWISIKIGKDSNAEKDSRACLHCKSRHVRYFEGRVELMEHIRNSLGRVHEDGKGVRGLFREGEYSDIECNPPSFADVINLRPFSVAAPSFSHFW
ncbi:hypothetical protein PMAYCL1PPCAC_28994 [Pristionchus mayeri]|uniref:C2H2-type domain-containing protein n=1 Tax=Pristionchus mayeri TaxID=1317129 RepID=A0AAN5IBQ0_9BILA|nr:hypothetical protein PMAYCL1PPCAC_28994 [Pristionchus mayeri]